jgi:hypothetical protein
LPDNDPSSFVGVGHDPDALSLLRSSDVASGYARDFETRNDLGQLTEDPFPLTPSIDRNDAWGLLHERVMGS